MLHDPKAVALLAKIDFPFAERFGPVSPARAQWQALRAACFDRQVVRFLADRPDATVVALGEGLETQFWRVDNGRVRWLTVDLPETIAVRRELLPSPPRGRLLACSALDTRWLDEVDPGAGVLVTAQGLLMYLAPAEVHGLLTTCAARIPSGALLFDAVSRRLSERSMRGGLGSASGYTPPKWTWGIDAEERRFIRGIDHVTALETASAAARAWAGLRLSRAGARPPAAIAQRAALDHAGAAGRVIRRGLAPCIHFRSYARRYRACVARTSAT